MRLFLPSVAILSLFAATSHAFSPPASSASRTSTHLHGELSGMLSEYSGSSTAATKVVEKVADAVGTPTVSTPPPSQVSPTEVADSAMDSVMKAASVAQDAADQAAAAAAAVAAKGAAATKAAAVAGGTVAGGFQLKPIVGGVFVPTTPDQAKLPFQVDPSKINSENQFDASARAKENLAIIKANFVNGIDGMKEEYGINAVSSGSGGGSTPSMDFSLPQLGGGDGIPTITAIIASLHFKEYGGWYAAAAMAFVASQQRSAGKEDASVEYEAELARAQEKANEAASAAGVAAEGAMTAKKLAMKMEKDLKKDGGQALLESSRSKMAQMEKDLMEKEMRALQAEVASLKTQLEKATGGKKKSAPKTKAVKTEIEEEYPTKVKMESDPDEDVRIIELLKVLDEENAIKKKAQAAEMEKKREEEAKFVAAAKAKAESKAMTKGVEAAQAKAEVAKKKKAATKKAAKKSATKKTATKKKTTAKAPTKKASRTVAAGPIDDWASLAESTLKRKTVAQLTEYLSGKGVSVEKSMKKAELMEAVKSL